MNQEVNRIIKKYNNEKSQLISILQDIQQEYGYLQEDVLSYVSKSMSIPYKQVYGVATFFKAFSLTPRGKHKICCCVGTACHVRGAEKIVDEFKRKLKIKEGETTPDKKFTLDVVNCVGACALGPVVIVDNKYYGGMSTKKISSILKNFNGRKYNEKDKK